MDNIRKIRDFLDGVLSDNEAKDFERELSLDSNLKADYLFQKELSDSILDEKYEDFEKMIAEIGYTYNNEKQPKKSFSIFNKKWWAVAASLLLIVSVTYFFVTNFSSNSNDLFKISDDFSLDTLRGVKDSEKRDSGGSLLDKLKWVAELYKHENYDDAYTKLRFLEKDIHSFSVAGLTDRFYFLGGIIEYKRENYESALDNLNQVSFQSSFFSEDVLWNKALILIKLKRFNEATSILETIKNSDHPKRHFAGLILKKLSTE